MPIPKALRRILLVGYPTIFVVLAWSIVHFNPFLFSTEKTYSGIFRDAFETSSFTPDGSNEKWWVTNSDSIFAKLPRPSVVETSSDVIEVNGVTLHITIRGKVSSRGKFGHLGKFDREFRLSETISVSQPLE